MRLGKQGKEDMKQIFLELLKNNFRIPKSYTGIPKTWQVNSAKNGKKCKKGKITKTGLELKTIENTSLYTGDSCF